MKALLPRIFAVILFLGVVLFAPRPFSPRPVSADFAKAYQDYIYTNNLYKESYTKYQVAKSTYLTYRTNAARNDAITALKTVLQNRNQVMVVYYDLMYERLLVAPGITQEYKTTFGSIRISEQTWLAANKTRIEAAATLQDLNTVSREFEGRYRQMESETKQALGTILLAKLQVIRTDLDITLSSVSAQLTIMDLAGENTTVYKRNLITTENKLQLYDEKMAAAKGTLIRPIGQVAEIFKGQQQLAEADQYLRDTVNSLLEIVTLITK